MSRIQELRARLAPALISAYAYHRQPDKYFGKNYAQGARSYCFSAMAAIVNARADLIAGKTRHAPTPPFRHWHDPERGERFLHVDNPAAFGFRFVGKYEDLTPRTGRSHTGWYVDNDQHGLMWGEVYQLPGRNGRARYYAAYDTDSWDGGRMIEMREVFESGAYADAEDSDARRDAAMRADGYAAREAEKEREYQAAWNAGAQYAEKIELIDHEKKCARKILAEIKSARRMIDPNQVKDICASLRRVILGARETIQELRDARDKLLSGDNDEYTSFYRGDERLRAAFVDGAGLTKFPEA